MTTSPDPDHTPLFDVDVPVAPTPVERLLALAGLYTQHNDRLDLLLFGPSPRPDPDACAASAHRLDRETLACITALRRQPLPAIEPVKNAVVRLKQLAYLTGGATRYLTAAQHVRPLDDADHTHPDLRRGFGQYVRLARELTALAPLTIIESAYPIAGRLPSRARSTTTIPTMDADRRTALLEIARGHIAVTGHDEHQRVHGHTVAVDTEMLRHLEAEGLVTREPASAPPFFPGGPPRDRARLTTLGTRALSTVLVSPHYISGQASGPVPVPAPGAVISARAHR
ncbi:hypothetical protein [Streptomyces caeruleatus]|uniref:Uncharacterized protein n=1 Tax=Streptomyces caeruleatus TaxID=661399 RepID=A0A101U5L2_9ACTN|nr:hypothetical protein [Streptomyces caeruleatus]KUO04631.1 hypothetical protein AQJ67_10545 [Streptomyces caeruleatus]